MVNLKYVFQKESFVKKVRHYLNTDNYNMLYSFINRTSWYIDSSTLLSVMTILDEQVTTLNNLIWRTPTLLPKDEQDVKCKKYYWVNGSNSSLGWNLEESGPNPQYQVILFKKKMLQLAIKTIRENLNMEPA